jgi:PAS domain-containing protein
MRKGKRREPKGNPRLTEAEKTLRALRSGLDALVVSRKRGERLLQLENSDLAYQRMIEQMSEGAVIIALDGTILYHNLRFAGMLQASRHKLTGTSIESHIAPALVASVKALLAKSPCSVGETALSFPFSCRSTVLSATTCRRSRCSPPI